MDAEHVSLENRHEVERKFHDAKAGGHHQGGGADFYAAGGLDQIWAAYLEAMGSLQGRAILDFGCGEGWSTLAYAERGAHVYSFDISAKSVENLIQDANEKNLGHQIKPAVMAAEQLGYGDGTFELVVGASILHHTDVSQVAREVARVLKPGGRALFIEPLAHNPALRVFRWLTPGRRTPTEQPMTVCQITDFARPFRSSRYVGFYLFSVFPQGLYWLTGNLSLFQSSLRFTEALDRWVLRVCPFLKRYCWSALIEVQK